MRYTDQKQITTSIDIEVEAPDGISYFRTFNEDDEIEYTFKLEIEKDDKFSTLYNIQVTKLLNYDESYFINYKYYNDYGLPWYLRDYFSGGSKKEDVTEEEFDLVKQQILSKF